MPDRLPVDSWASGDSYEPFIGRWSRSVAAEFVDWVGVPAGARWLDVGCGTGALSQAVIDRAAPASVSAVEPSPEFAAYAEGHVTGGDFSVSVGDAEHVGLADASVDAVVSGLVLNFVPDPGRALVEMRRVAKPRGVVAAYVWDYPGQMQLLRHFWDAAVELDQAATALHEGNRFRFCTPEALDVLFTGCGLDEVRTTFIDVPTVFCNFDDYWRPFLGGQGPAPTYLASLDAAGQKALREEVGGRLPVEADGSISLVARAWAVRGIS
jgi:SAM-dependent methyltransferase